MVNHMNLDKNSQLPLYRQLMDEIMKMIHTGKYKSGDKIPTEPELSKMYDVSRITVRRTIEELCNQGYLVKRQGKGTFVEIPKIYRKVEQENNMSFSDACKANGRKPLSKLLSCKTITPESWMNQFFQFPVDELVYHIERVLGADDLPIIYEHLYLPTRRFSDFQAEKLDSGSLFQIFREEYQIQPEKMKSRTTIEAGISTADVSEHLRISVGEPIMMLGNYARDEKGIPIYMSREIIVGNRYMLSV